MALNKSIVAFAGADNKFYERFSDYCAHRIASEKNSISAATYDTSMSLTEKANRVNTEFFAELERVSGITRGTSEVEMNAYAANPQVRWATFAIIDYMLDIVIPMLNDDFMAPFVQMQNIGVGDIARITVKPGDYLTVSASANGERQTLRTRKFEREYTIAPRGHMISTYTKYFNVVNGKEPVCDYTFQVAQSFNNAMTDDAWDCLANHLANDSLRFTGTATASDIVHMCEYIERLNGGMKPIIMGTAGALMKLPGRSDIPSGFTGNYDAASGKFGFVSDFFGYQTYKIPHFLNDVTRTGNPMNASFSNSAALESKMGGGLTIGGTSKTGDEYLVIMSTGLQKPVQGALGQGFNNSNDYFQNADLTDGMTFRKDWDYVCVHSGYMGLACL